MAFVLFQRLGLLSSDMWYHELAATCYLYLMIRRVFLHPSSNPKMEVTFPLKHFIPSTKIHDVMAQKTNLYSAVKRPNPTVIFIQNALVQQLSSYKTPKSKLSSYKTPKSNSYLHTKRPSPAVIFIQNAQIQQLSSYKMPKSNSYLHTKRPSPTVIFIRNAQIQVIFIQNALVQQLSSYKTP